MLMVQSPESTDYDGMPRSAIATGMIDYVLPPAEMADALISYTSRAFGKTSDEAKAPEQGKEESLNTILRLLRSHTNHDFSHYKPTTVSRRIERRMALLQIDSIEKYVEYVHTSEEELDIHKKIRDVMIFSEQDLIKDPPFSNLDLISCF